ncbi:hypothetical protein PG999_004951 [Apiospora kogelbergensis]|uniref:Uncharacterized protein n=2 Tax=Apiospora kogelbergensis TaxID=1337665 RepID=A0AAW0R0R4_9PEZI
MDSNDQPESGTPLPRYEEICHASSPPPVSGEFFEEFPGESVIGFQFFPEPTEPRNAQPWFGQLCIKAINVPQMMKEGFFINEENIIREEGYIEPNDNPPDDSLKKYKYIRHYYLRDLKQPPQWAGYLQCMAYDIMPELARIRPEILTHRNVGLCMAYNTEENLIYYFDIDDGGINAIYDDKPLKGLWPWPRDPEEGDGRTRGENN